jgi:hypothetical protein
MFVGKIMLLVSEININVDIKFYNKHVDGTYSISFCLL